MKLVLVVLVLMFAGCTGDGRGEPPKHPKPAAEIPTPSGFEVQKLFEAEGCTVFRFYDREPSGGYYPKYFVRCSKQKQTVTEHVEPCGKGCTRNVTTVTVQEDKE